MNKLIPAILIAFAGCAHTQNDDIEGARLRSDLKLVVIEDGISELEATVIARNYFHKYVGCGVFNRITDGGKYWIVNGAFGYAGMPVEGFHIDKGTGKITSPIGPSLDSPAPLLKPK